MRDFFRYQIIEGLLTTGRVPVKELTGRVNERLKDLREAEVSKQQIDKDISFMRNRCFAEIKTLRDGVPGYQYAPDSPRIFAANIRQRSKQDESELDFAIAMLDGRANLPLLRRGLDIINRLVNASFRQRGRNIIMQENHAEEVAGSKWINELYTRITSKEAIVVTEPMQTWSMFLQQRIRWASKAVHYQDKRIVGVLLGLYLLNACFLLLFCSLFWHPLGGFFFFLFLLAKVLIEFPFMRTVAGFFSEEKLLAWFVLLQPIHILYTLIAGWLGRFGSYTWKGRVIQNFKAG